MKETLNLTENVHQREKWTVKLNSKAQEELSQENYLIYQDYSNEMIRLSLSVVSRHKNLTHFVKLSRLYGGEWKSITEHDVKRLVGTIMELHSDNGQESNYSQDLKKSIRTIVRFALTGTRAMPIEGELPLLRCVKSRTPKDKLSREDLPTNEDVQKLLDVCADSPRDKALIAVQNEAGTRINELLTLQIKHVKVDEYGAIISVDGKTGARKIRIVSSVPYLTKWINTHPYREDPESPLWVYLGKATYFGNPMSYAGFNNILRKRIKQAKITKRIHSHLFRHREITELAGKLTEAESRIRHGWTKSSPMPARYTHLNQEDLDEKMLQIKGVKKQDEPEKESLRECVYCKIKHPIDMKYCEVCSRPLDVTEATRMEEEQEERTKVMIQEILRQEHANKSKSTTNREQEMKIQEQKKEIKQLKELIKITRKHT